MTKISTPISLNELARELDINKSTLQYYVKYGLFFPSATVGKMNIFDKTDFIQKFTEMSKLKKEGMSLKDIRETINEKNKKRKN